ncbi:MAG: amidohydrolase family protein [Terrimonas sp.]|nr:amidohydrolase family protein [Terrimonas sp.]
MKKLFILFLSVAAVIKLSAQANVYPAPEQKGLLYITHATIHVGNGTVIQDGTIRINNGKIEEVGTALPVPNGNVQVLDVKGKQVYPGLIQSSVELGLVEVSSVRASSDVNEIGTINPNVRSIVAYNTDSKVINTLRNNGILLANVVPGGSLITGSSTVVQLDAWNWEDAAYKMDNGIHFDMPSLLARRGGRGGFGRFGQQASGDPVERAMTQINEVKDFFREAKAYLAETDHPHENTNLKFEAVRGLFEKKQKLFIHCDIVKQMLIAVDFVKEFGFDVVIVGGSDSWMIADLLKQNNIPVILNQMHSLPTMMDDDVDQPYKTPSLLQKAGVLFAINDQDDQFRGRNLAFNAGTAAAYGLSKEEALSAITLNAAKILGIDKMTGSIEKGKDANIVVCDGDILDMRSQIITDAFIQGRKISLDDKQKQLYERYKYKYGIQ